MWDQQLQRWQHRPADVAANAVVAKRARLLNNLGVRLSDLGRQQEALTATTEAVDVYRHLAELNPTTVEPDLARG